MAWSNIEPDEAAIGVDYDRGHISWNESAQQLLRYPSKVNIVYDQTAARLGLVSGQDFSVVKDEDGDYHITVDKDDLDAAGLTDADYEALASAVEWLPEMPEPIDGLVTVPYPE